MYDKITNQGELKQLQVRFVGYEKVHFSDLIGLEGNNPTLYGYMQDIILNEQK